MVSQRISCLIAISVSSSTVSALSRGINIDDVYPLSAHVQGSIDSSYRPTTDYSQYALSESVQSALKIIKDVERLPSCQKMANAALIHDCAVLESPVSREHYDTPPGSDLLLDESKRIYAARMAVCELHTADVHVPDACQSFIPTSRTARRRVLKGLFAKGSNSNPTETFPDYEQVTENTLSACIKALHDEGNSQGWTSYSGSLKHAAPLCHAMRSEVDKDEQIHLFKVLVSSTHDVAKAMSASKEEWGKFKAQFHELRTGLRQFHFDLVREDQTRQQAAHDLWSDVERQMRDGLAGFAETIQDLQQRVVSTAEDIDSKNDDLNSVFEGVSSRVKDLDLQHQDAMGSIVAEASALQNILAYYAESFQQGIIQGVYNATQNLELANAIAKKNRDSLQESDLAVLGLISHISELSLQVGSIGQDLNLMKTENQRMYLEAQIEGNRTVEVFQKLGQEAEGLSEGLQSLVGLYKGGWLSLAKTVTSFIAFTFICSLFAFAIWSNLKLFTTSGNICVALASGLTFAYIFASFQSKANISQLFVDLWHSLSESTTPFQRWLAAFILAILWILPRSGARSWFQSLFLRSHEETSETYTHQTTQLPMHHHADEEAFGTRQAFRLPFNDPKYLASKMLKK